MALAVNFDKEDIKLKKAVSNQVQSVLSNAQARAEAVQGNNSSTINGGITNTIKDTARNVVDTKKRQEKEVTEAYRNNEIGIEDDRLQALFRERAKQNTSEYADDKQKAYFEQKKFEEENKVERAAAKTQTNLDDFLERNNVDDIRRVINSGIDYDKEINDIDSRLNVLTSQAETTSDPISYGYIQKEYDELSQQKASLEKDRDVFNEFNKYYTDTYVLEKGTDKEKSRVADVINSEDDTIAERLVKGTGANLLGIAQGGLALFDTVRDMGGELWADNIERSARAELESGDITQETYEKMLQRADEYRSFQANAEENWSQQLREEINYMNLEIQEGLSTPEKFVVDSINGTTNFLMQFALLGEVGSLAMMSVQSGTGKYYELLDQNYDPKTAFLNGALTGFASYMTEKIGMDNFVSVISGQAGQSAFGQILDAVSKGQIANYYVQSVLTGAMAEGLEEVVEGLVDPVFDSVTLGVPLEYNIGDIFYSFLVGAASGALMSGAGAIQGSRYVVNTKLQYNQLAADIQTTEEILRDPEVTPEDAERLRHEIEKGRFALSNFEENSKVAMAVDKASDQVVPTTKMEGDAALSQSVYPEAVKVVNDSNMRQQQIADITGRINNITNQWLQNSAIDISSDDYMNASKEARYEIKKAAEYADKLGRKVRFENDETIRNTLAEQMRENGATEEEVQKAYDPKTFVDGYVKDGKIVLNTSSKYGQLSTLVHEFTHGTESSKYYGELKDLAEKYLADDYQSRLDETRRMYKGVADDPEHELVAKTLQDQMLLGNEKFLDDLVRYHESLAYRIFSGIRSMASFDGKAKIENAFMKAFRDADTNKTGTKYLLGYDDNGVPIYGMNELQNDPDFIRAKGNSFKAKLRNYLNGKYNDTVIDIGGMYEADYNKSSTKEFVYPSTPLTFDMERVKSQTATDLNDLFKTAKPIQGRMNIDEKGGTKLFDHFSVEFGIEDGDQTTYYTGTVNVRIRPDGTHRFYDLTELKEKSRSANRRVPSTPPASTNTIPSSSDGINSDQAQSLIDDFARFFYTHVEDMDFMDYAEYGTIKEQTETAFKDNPDSLIEVIEEYIENHEDETDYIEEGNRLIERIRELAGDRLNDASEDVRDIAIVNSTEGSAAKFSLGTWTATDKEKVSEDIQRELNVSKEKADKWIEDVNSVAKIIADNKALLDYEANSRYSAMKSNDEYVASMDMSTLCKKRELLQGTIDEIQSRLPNYDIDGEQYTKIRQMMKERGYEVSCGFCYVESRRKELGKVAKKFIDSRNYSGLTVYDLTTVSGVNALQQSNPEIYEDFVSFNNKRGSGKVNLVESRTEYRGEIMRLSKASIDKILRIGGLRLQSYSDFETPHLIDMMQIVVDMSRRGLTSQAYTKIPNFADAFGDTGIKINESLVCTGVDENGKLIFDDVEGMNHEKAFEIRDKHPYNVGTILVGKDDATILSAMADDRIDFIIPFHRSGWGQAEYERLGIKGYKDYTSQQKEYWLHPEEHKKSNGKLENAPADQYYPIDYWDYTKSGKENAETYLRLCAENGRIPKFSNFLVNNGDGSWSLQPDGSTDGYWKMLIDFKMYDNDGIGAPQKVVQPIFNNTLNEKIMSEYEGEHRINRYAPDVVDDFVKEIKESGAEFSLTTDSQGRELSKGQKEYFKDSKIRDEDGNLQVVYHGTDADFTVFDRTKGRSTMDIQGSFFSPWEIDAEGYGSNVKPYYLNITNPASEGEAYKALNRFKGQNNAGIKAREYLESLGYDGVNNGNEEYIAFSPEQIKSVDNKNPTSSNDIRFSLGEADKDPGNAVIREDFRRGLGRVDFETEEEMDEYNRVLDKAVEEAYLNDEVSEDTISKLADLYYEGVKETITTEGSYTQKEVKDFLKNYPISTQSMMGRDNYKDVRKDKFDKGGYGEFGKEEWNEVLRKNKGNNGLFRFLDNDKLYGEAAAMDTVYQEFLERFPGLGMNPDATTSKDMFDEIIRAYKSLAPVTYREAIASYDEVREDVDNAVEKMVDDIIERKGFQEHMEELDITEDQLKKMLVDRNKKLDKIVEDNEKFFRDNAKQWVPNFQVMKDKFNVIDENILGYAAYDHIFHGEMSEHTKDMLFENIVKNDLARELQGNLANEYIDDLVKYIDQTIELDTNYRSNQKFNDSVAGKTNKILEAYEGKDNIDTYDQVENDAKLKKQIKEMRKATREEISDAIAYIMENGKNKVNTLDMKSMWDYGRIVAQNNPEVAEAWNTVFNEPFFAAQSTLKNTLESEGENLERVMKETGIRGNTPEAKAVGWIIEGHKQGEKNGTYTEANLREEFGDKADNILKFAKEYREAMERMYNNINEVLDKTYGDSEVNANLMMAKLSEKARLLEYTVQDLREKAKTNNSREIYNELKKAEGDLDRANRSRDAFAQRIREKTEKGRQELLHKENYFHHVKDGHPVAVAKRFIKNVSEMRKNGIPSELIGLTDRTSPLTRWSTLFLHQGRNDYSSDGIASWSDYISEYANLMAFNPLTMYMRDAVAEMRAQDPDSQMNNIIRFMEHWTNSIDGKSHWIDRGIRDTTNPKIMDGIRGINSLAKKNAVMGNIGSAIVQFGNLPLGLSLMQKEGGVKATEDFMRGITNYIRGKKYTDLSPFMGVRYFDIDTRDAGVYDNIQRKLNAMMEFGDKTVADILWNGFFEQGKRLKGNIPTAIQYADEMTRRSIAGRSVGEVPLTLQSSFVNLFIPFQVEVNNQWQQMKDLSFTPWREGSKGNRGREALSSAGALTTLVVTSYVLNMLMESILGRRPLFDPLDALLEGIQNGDDDDAVWGRVWGEILSAMPGGQYIPGLVGMSEDDAEKMFGESDPSRYGVGNIGVSAAVNILREFGDGKPLDALSDLLANFNPIGGGKQIQKTIEGLQGMGVLPKFNGNYTEGSGKFFDKGSGSFLNPKNWERNTKDYSKSGKLRFENDPNNIADYFTSAIGGRWNTSAAREYIKSGFKVYSQTNENISDVLSSIGHPMYRQMYEGKVSGENAYKFRQALEQEGIWDDFMKEVENRYIDYQSTVPIDEKAKTFAQFINDQYGLTKKVVEGTFTPTEPVTTEAEPEKSESFFDFMNKEKEEISNLYSELKNADEEEKADILEEIEDKKSYLNNKTYSNYAETNKLNSRQQESFRDAMNLDGLYKDSKGNVTDDNVSGSKKIRNSEAIETRKALEDMGQYDNVLDYIAENGLDYSDFGLSKTVVGWDDAKFDAKYDEMFGDGSSNTSESSTKSSTKTSTGRTSRASGRRSSGSSRSTGQSDFQRHFNSVLARTRTNRYSNTISLLDELLKARRNKA